MLAIFVTCLMWLSSSVTTPFNLPFEYRLALAFAIAAIGTSIDITPKAFVCTSKHYCQSNQASLRIVICQWRPLSLHAQSHVSGVFAAIARLGCVLVQSFGPGPSRRLRALHHTIPNQAGGAGTVGALRRRVRCLPQAGSSLGARHGNAFKPEALRGSV